MSNHGDVERGVDYKDACRPCGGTRAKGKCVLCGREPDITNSSAFSYQPTEEERAIVEGRAPSEKGKP
jgi:hypothetical protein